VLFKNVEEYVSQKDCPILSKVELTSSYYFGEYYKLLARYGKAYNFYKKAYGDMKKYDQEK
jgi:hypothetical protein